ncbi:hypothetical protein A3Q56_03797 [Intoshia linei]|uniref:Uncharacterized protein n=1 Tax=Intoshia linei TaxID=1819745 RepID=A0A177B2E2_9BILA|nr:hypothetical protein A3Q56_03797 [Intoshia linei]
MKTIEIVNKTHAVYNVKINCEDECLFADNVSENFNFTLDTNKKIKIEYSNDCEKILSVLQNYYTIHADRYRANLKEIVLSTLNKTQSIPVIIKFNLPNLTISKSNVNFFNYINTTEKYEINIMNKSQYDYSFKYQIDNEEFAIELDSPKLLKNTKYNILKGNEQKTLTITHKYTSPEKISTKLVIIGFYGDCHTVRIESNASHDEKYKH